MGKALLKVLLKFIVAVANIFLTPIDLLITNALPDLTVAISYVNNVIDNYVSKGIYWFFYLVPDNVVNAFVLYATVYVSLYLLSYTIHGVLAIIKIIKNIKIW